MRVQTDRADEKVACSIVDCFVLTIALRQRTFPFTWLKLSVQLSRSFDLNFCFLFFLLFLSLHCDRGTRPHLAEVDRTAEQIACSKEFALRRSLVLNLVLFKLITTALR